MVNAQKQNNCNSIILTSENTYLALHPRPAYTFLVYCLLSSLLPLFLTVNAVKLNHKIYNTGIEKNFNVLT
jgi:hypothetical protein